MIEYDPFEHQAGHVKLVDCRNTVHITLCQHRPSCRQTIDRINDDCYFVRSTSEIRFYDKNKDGVKSDNIRSIKRAFNNLKKLINCNYDTPDNVRFVTLTYAENMTDNTRIRPDFSNFIRRMKQHYGSFRWLYVKEQQARGAWHLHCLMFFDDQAPYMSNDDINHPVRDMWGHGFVTIEGIRQDANNLGNYLCAYFTDDKSTGKKGSRLLNYDAGIRLYNCSRDIIRPVESVISFDDYLEYDAKNIDKEISTYDTSVHLKTGADLRIRYKIYHSN